MMSYEILQVFTFSPRNEEFQKFCQMDEATWKKEFLTPISQEHSLKKKWDEFMKIMVQKVSLPIREVELPGNQPIKYSFDTSAVTKEKKYVDNLLEQIGEPKEGVKSITVHPDNIHPKMEFDMQIYCDPNMGVNTVIIDSPKPITRLDKLYSKIL